MSLSYYLYFFPFLLEHVETYYIFLLRACNLVGKCYSVRVFVTVPDHLIQLGIVMSIIPSHFPFLTLYLLPLYAHVFLKLLHEGCIVSLSLYYLPLDAFPKGFGGYSDLYPLDEILQAILHFILT